MDTAEIWSKALEQIKERLGKELFEAWIAPLKASADKDNLLTLHAPDSFFKDWVHAHYQSLIQEAVNTAAQKDLVVALETTPEAFTASAVSRGPALASVSTEPLATPGLNSRYSFENFVVGSSNHHAHAYSLAVADSPAKTYNPLFIYGGVGLGKTHLMQAICHKILKNSPQTKFCYTSSERFTNELIDAIQHHSTPRFRQKYRNLDVLVIDDIQFIAGKESTQEEFFHTFNALYDAHKQIILSSDRPPKQISDLQDRLVSRFSWGLTTDIQPPELETRVAILKKKIEREHVSVPEEVIFFIAHLIKTNIRELEGALVRTIAHSLLEEKEITLDLTKEVLKDLLKEPKKLITVDFIQRCVGEEFGMSLQDFKTKNRTKSVVLPRQVAMYLSRELTDLSLPEIGVFFGGKDHTTVLHSYNKIKGELSKDGVLKNKVERVVHIIQQ